MLRLYFSTDSSEITLYTDEKQTILNDFTKKPGVAAVQSGIYTPDTAQLARNFA